MKRLLKAIILCLVGFLILAIARYAYVRTEYPKLLTRIEHRRDTFARDYQSAQTEEERKEVVSLAREYLQDVLSNEVFPSWYATPWAFHGNTEYPLQGRIACGAFVENVLRHCGLVLDRRLSAQPAEIIIKNLITDKSGIRRFSNVSIESFIVGVEEMGEGIYVVGLDSHVGFLYILKGTHRFVHSHGYLFVMPEFPSISRSLRRSRYRVVGKLFDRPMIEKWLLKKRLPLKHDYFKKQAIGTTVDTN